MIQNYIVTVFRALGRNTFFSGINILGLTLGFTCFAIILLYTERELAFDRFHHDAESIYRVAKEFVNQDGSRIPDATTPPALATAMKEELAEVKAVTRFVPNRGRRYLLEYNDKRFYELNVLRVDNNFFQVFDFPFALGNASKPFQGLHCILLTESAAEKYFGKENPLGKTIRMNVNNGTDYLVTGILKNVPDNSHFSFDIIIPFESRIEYEHNWKWNIFYTYTRMQAGTEAKALGDHIRNLIKKYQPETLDHYFIQPLTDIHLNSKLKWELDANGNRMTVNIMLAIAVFVMVMAGVNYVNLTTAQAMKRAKEIGIRKVTGGSRLSLVLQFLLESMITIIIALALSIISISLLLPGIKAWIGVDLNEFILKSKWILTVFPLCALLVGLLSGIYPALFLSGFQPLTIMRGKFSATQSGIKLRQTLVVFQFTLSAALIIGTLIVTEQLDFIANKDLGFDQHGLIMLPNIRGGIGREPYNPEAMAEDLKKIHSIKKVARADGVFGLQNSTTGITDKDQRHHIVLNFVRADYDFIPALDIALNEGRNFSTDFPSDSSAIILNEKAVSQLGLQEPLLGQTLTWDDADGKTHPVTLIGVVKDFHFNSFHEEIKPFGFILEVNNGSTFFLKVKGSNLTNYTRH